MRLTPKKIEQILVAMLGEEGLPLIKELMNKDNISEFDLATKVKKDIKVVRKMLYTLYNSNLVAFTRKKDKIKGWYIYYWTLVPESVRFNYFKMIRERVAKLEEQLEQEKRELFFVCPNKCTRLNFDQAMDFEFHCPECGQLINQDNSEIKVELIVKEIAMAQEELAKSKEEKKIKKKAAKERRKKVKAKKKVVKTKKKK
jgi:transcription initiation factor TFIIE subunit alpha